jgi:hypothetical protein
MTDSEKEPKTIEFLFASKSFLAIAAVSAVLLWTLFNTLDGLILLSPVLTFYLPIPDDAVFGFVLSIVTSIIAGLVISMNFRLVNSGFRKGTASLISGSTLGTISSVCASCSSVGFYLASTFGVAGVAASSLLSTYQVPIRIVAIGVLLIAFVTAQRKIGKRCDIST